MNELTVMKILKVKVDISQADKEPMVHPQGIKKIGVWIPQSIVVISRKHKYLNDKSCPAPASQREFGTEEGLQEKRLQPRNYNQDCTVWQEVAFDADRLCLCVFNFTWANHFHPVVIESFVYHKEGAIVPNGKRHSCANNRWDEKNTTIVILT